MSIRDRLEIIRPGGEVQFHDLDPDKDTLTIGMDSEVDLGLPAFRAKLDYRQVPWRFVLVEGEASLDGKPLESGVGVDWPGGSGLEVGDYVLLPLPSESVTVDFLAYDPSIGVELLEDEATVAVGGEAFYRLTITNKGSDTIDFAVKIQGSEQVQNWTTLHVVRSDSGDKQLPVSLNPRDSATIDVKVAPPPGSESRAGAYSFTIDVFSPQYDIYAKPIPARLHVKPYYRFAIGGLRPQESIERRRARGARKVARLLVWFSVVNQGNSEARFRIEGRDHQGACQLGVRIPGEEVRSLAQAELCLEPGQESEVPIEIKVPRLTFGWGRQRYRYRVTATSLSQDGDAQWDEGQIAALPRFGPLALLGAFFLLILVPAILIAAVFRPSIESFTVDPKNVVTGTPVTIGWRVSHFAQPWITPYVEGISVPEGTVTVVPTGDVIYSLAAENWLSRLAPKLFAASEQREVKVLPLLPSIVQFEPNRSTIDLGDTVTVSWQVLHADGVTLFIDDSEETLNDPIGSREEEPGTSTKYRLVAVNRYAPEGISKILTVEVRPTPTITPTPTSTAIPTWTPTPTPTPLPTPLVLAFDVQPGTITAGDSVTLTWSVDNVANVSISPRPGAGLPPKTSVPDTPQESTNYVLYASNGQPGGDVSRLVSVKVNPPATPTPTPKAPTLVYAEFDRQTATVGQTATLRWKFKGDVTDVQVHSADFGSRSGLPKEGSIGYKPAVAKEYAVQVLAFNGAAQTPAEAKLTVDAPKPTIDRFSISAESPVDGGKVDPSGDDPNKYEIDAGTRIIVSWVTSNAKKAELSINEAVWGEVQTTGEHLRQIGSTDETYTLVVENAAGETETRTLTVLVDLLPSAPTSVQGERTASQLAIRIGWKFEPHDRQDILGFRIYRAVIPGRFTLAAHEGSPFLGPAARDWTDWDVPAGAKCGLTGSDLCPMAYYVVTVYGDADGDPQETGASNMLQCEDSDCTF